MTLRVPHAFVGALCLGFALANLAVEPFAGAAWVGVHTDSGTERALAAGDQLGAGAGIPAREERHVVPGAHELLGEIRDDPLRPAIKLRWDSLHERRNLGNPHFLGSFCAFASIARLSWRRAAFAARLIPGRTA